ncbi:hypothetical protein [Pyxidicoccus sp. MSG2]|uniref:hypothetical protein n=1 Tax=Pyxidicoccus sp. MSG2 TaxID=2996790 RepID=UPI00226EB53A|nr:hypothetical protein [Pyxidicoccus sp. MSG2]MCY1017704.1 hypothetical protein [Pyxidicoccus sp. MSG2]
MQENNSRKFVIYGPITGHINFDTEVVGTVVFFAGDDIYLRPIASYEHLSLEGNRRYPAVETNPDDIGVWTTLKANLNTLGLPHTSVLKLETYAVGTVPDPTPDFPGGDDAPVPQVLDDGVKRPIQIGDVLRVRGQYAVDYSHSPYGIDHSESFSYMRGLYKTGFVHAELHPYRVNEMEPVRHGFEGMPVNPEQPRFKVEEHAYFAPIYTEVYDWTWGTNKLGGVAGHMVEEAKHGTRTYEFTIAAPPKPICYGTCQLKFETLNLGQYDIGTPAEHSVTLNANGLAVRVVLTAQNHLDPGFLRMQYKLWWHDSFRPSLYVNAGDAYDCAHFSSQAQAQSVLRANPSDPNRLDPDGNKIACESNPAPHDLWVDGKYSATWIEQNARPGNNATFVSQSFPAWVSSGGSFSASVTLRNTGTVPWSRLTAHRLGSQSPQDNTNWGLQRVDLPVGVVIYPGQTATFSFTARAPSVNTSTSMAWQWRMVQEMIQWFGDFTPYRSIAIEQPSPTCSGTTPYYCACTDTCTTSLNACKRACMEEME